MARRAILIGAGLLLVVGTGSPAFATNTAKFGGLGGDRTVIMECPAGAFIVGASGTGYATLLGMNLVRSLGFQCRSFGGPDGTTPATTVTNTLVATTNKANGVSDRSEGSASCTTGRMVVSINLKSGAYIDRVSAINCKAPADLSNFSAPASLEKKFLNIGGTGGFDGFMSCPSGEAMYAVSSRVGDAIDTLMGSCRRIQASPPETVMETSITPQPPIDLASGGITAVRFTVPTSAVGATFRFGVAAKVKPVSKSSSLTGPPSFAVHILDPTGQLAIGTGTFTSVAANALQYVSVRLTQTGTHFIRVINQTTGQTIQVTSFDVTR